MKILLLNFDTALGSAMHATPIPFVINQLYPEGRVDIICSELSRQVFAYNPYVRKVISSPSPTSHFFNAAKRAIEIRIKGESWDYALFSAFNCRTKVLAFSHLLPIVKRGGFAVRRQFVDTLVNYNPSLSLISNNLQLLRCLGGQHLDQIHAPQIWFSDAETQMADYLLREQLGEVNEFPLLGVFCGTSGGHPNQWYEERFVETLNRLHHELGARAVFFGTDRDIPMVESIRGSLRTTSASMAGKTTVPLLAALCAKCDYILGVDTGGIHVAWAVGTPTLVLGHAANQIHIWLPLLNPRVRVLRMDEAVPCAGCRRHYCETRECMDAISTTHVLNEFANLSARYPFEVSSREVRVKNSMQNLESIRETRR